MATSKVTLKLLINKMERKVVFAEANKDFVDFLFYILSLPVGSVVKLLENKTTMMGCLGDLYQSIEALSATYMQPNQDKNAVLNPKFPKCPTEIPLLLPDNNSRESKALKFYTCPSVDAGFGGSYRRHLYLADNPFSSCPICRKTMNSEMAFVSQGASTSSAAAVSTERGFVKEVVTYMVMDNLEVTPMSTISCIAWLNKFNVGDLGSLEEKVVNFGLDENAHGEAKPTLAIGNCDKCSKAVNTRCARCSSFDNDMMRFEVQQLNTVSDTDGGVVKKSFVYMVTDDLSTTPASVISAAGLLQGKIKDIGALEERVVYIGPEEVLELLNASMQTNEAFTAAFLPQEE